MARARWLIRFFTAASNCPKVLSYPSGMKIGSYPTPPFPRSSSAIRPSQAPSKTPRISPPFTKVITHRKRPHPCFRYFQLRQLRDEFFPVLNVARIFTGKPGRINTRSLFQGIHLQTGIIRQYKNVGKNRTRFHGLDLGIFLESRAGFIGWGYFRVVGQIDDMVKKRSDQLAAIESGLFQKADENKGRLRNFLLRSLKNFLSNERQKDNAQKRGERMRWPFS